MMMQTSPVWQWLCLALLILLPAGLRAEASAPVISDNSGFGSPDGRYEAFFRQTHPESGDENGTLMVLQNHDRHSVFQNDDTFQNRLVTNVRWSNDSKFIVITTASAGGHSPWHYKTWLFSLVFMKCRYLDEDKVGVGPIISSEIWMQDPDLVILVTQDFSHNIGAPDDPKLVKFSLSKLWDKLK